MTKKKIDNRQERFLRKIERTIRQCNMLGEGDAVLAGVSGGPDSVALLHTLYLLAPRFSLKIGIAHLNHGLRRKASDKDAAFVKSIAKACQLPCYVKKRDVKKYREKNRLSLEEAARDIRYQFLCDVAEKQGYHKIAVAHHMDDNAELILMNLFRGSGKRGLAGMPAVRDKKIIRPFIYTLKKDIDDFVESNQLQFVIDKTNKDMRYFRNRIRHQLMPLLKDQYSSDIVGSLNRMGRIVRDEDEWVDTVTETLFKTVILDQQNHCIRLSVKKITDLPPAAGRRIIRKAIKAVKGDLRRITFIHIDSVLRFIEKDTANGALDFPDRIRVKCDAGILTCLKEKIPLRQCRESVADEALYEHTLFNRGFKPRKVLLKEPGVYLKFSVADAKTIGDMRMTGHKVAFFDMDKMHFPLIIRNCRQGDTFTPLGMSGKQKVSKFFINNKINRTERAVCPILLSRKKIIWVVGHRIDDYVKVNRKTRHVLKVELLAKP